MPCSINEFVYEAWRTRNGFYSVQDRPLPALCRPHFVSAGASMQMEVVPIVMNIVAKNASSTVAPFIKNDGRLCKRFRTVEQSVSHLCWPDH